jgi:hypothetical protein
MAESDWTVCSSSVSSSSLDRGVTHGIVRPNGGGSFVYGFNSLAVVAGATALFCNQTNFAPTPPNKGGSVRGAVKRGLSGGQAGFSPFLFIGLQGPDVSDKAYLLGLSDADPHSIVVRKGTLSVGIPDSPIGENGVLGRSTETFEADTWLHLRLDMVVNLTGDVILKAFHSDLLANTVSSPIWLPISGLPDFVDDTLGINTASAPFTSGRFGFGMQVADAARRSFFDQIEVSRQI